MNGPAAKPPRRRAIDLFDDSSSLSPDELKTLKKMITAYNFSRMLFWALVSLGTVGVAAVEAYSKIKGGP